MIELRKRYYGTHYYFYIGISAYFSYNYFVWKGRIMSELQENTPYDDVFKTQKMECPRLLIPIINEAFQKNYKENTEIIRLENEIFLRKQDGYEEKRITDAVIQIKDSRMQSGRSYHIECQSTKDASMIVRMYEYDSQIALKDKEWDGKILKVKFPHSAIVYLRSDDTMLKDITMILNTPENETGYQIPLIKLKDYNLNTIFEKHLFILLPFWIFTYEERLQEYEENENRKKELTDDFRIIIRQLLENCENGIIDEYIKCMITDMTKKVVRNLLKDKFPKVREEVETMMGGKVLDFEAKRIKDQAIKEGRAEAYKAGLESLINILTSILPDFDTIYEKIVSDERYKDVKREEIMKYYQD